MKYELVPPSKLAAPIRLTYPSGKVRVYTLAQLLAQRDEFDAAAAQLRKHDPDRERLTAAYAADRAGLDDHIRAVEQIVGDFPGQAALDAEMAAASTVDPVDNISNLLKSHEAAIAELRGSHGLMVDDLRARLVASEAAASELRDALAAEREMVARKSSPFVADAVLK